MYFDAISELLETHNDSLFDDYGKYIYDFETAVLCTEWYLFFELSTTKLLNSPDIITQHLKLAQHMMNCLII